MTGKSSPDGYITLNVHPEVSAITSFLTGRIQRYLASADLDALRRYHGSREEW